MKHYLLLFLSINVNQLNAQLHSDCNTALLICNKQTVHIESVDGAGADITELNDASCFLNSAPGNYESNSCWFKFTASQSGILYFVITPDSPADDLDFAVFQMVDNADCLHKKLMRCMAAGSISGDSSSCYGPTGLLPSETDTLEDAGCLDPDDNNFLAPVSLEAGKTYALCIQNFSSFNGFRVDFCGTALLGCETEICDDLTATDSPKQPVFQLRNLFPNPVSGAVITLDIELEEAEDVALTLVSSLGQTVRSRQVFISSGRQSVEFPVEKLSSGAYWLQMADRHGMIARMAWINR